MGKEPLKKDIKSISELPCNNPWIIIIMILQAQSERDWDEKITAYTLFVALKLAID